MGKAARQRAERQAEVAADPEAVEEERSLLDRHYDLARDWLDHATDEAEGPEAAKAIAIARVHAQLANVMGLCELKESIDGLATRAIGDIDKLTGLVLDLEHEARFAGSE